jgi:nitroimidazol reductase NimA-like FMN-containing flavoprotein (pyridoxamine 5'-phosphate oxidase superfamily)
MQEEATTRRLLELSADECWELATTRPVGRLAWNGPQGPTVIPVNFTVDGHRLWIRTTAYSAAAREGDDSPVAFQLDSFDADHRTGWSVLMRGRAHFEHRLTQAESPGPAPEPWVSGPRSLAMHVDVDEITGRRLGGTED